MLDGNFKNNIDKFWDFLAKGLAQTGLSPNQVTLAGLIGVAVACLIYLLWGNALLFGIMLAICFAADSLDGAVARITNTQSLFGGYLDAVVDRYQEVLVFGAIAQANGMWPVCFLAMSGSLLISYNKARTALEIPVDNQGWPDLMERMERVIWIVAVLVLEGLWPGKGILFWGIVILALLSHLTALQRFFRARQMLEQHPQNHSSEGSGL